MEASVEQKLQALYNLQLIDLKLDQIENMKGELPMEVKDLEDTIEGLETRLDKFNSDIKNLEENIKERKAAMKNSQSLIQRYESQQNDVKNNREYLALTKEVELQKLEIMANEKKIKENQLEIEEKKTAIESTKAELEDRKSELEAKNKELVSISKEHEKEEGKLEKVRESATETIENRLLQAYKRVRQNVKNKLAVVTIERDACGGCFSAVPPQRQLDVRQRKKVIVCENCGRILVDHDLAESTREKLEA